MVGKFLLPPLGSTPSVWNTTVLFFQATLLAGYLWSHFTRRLHPAVQVATLALGVVSLPIAVAADLTPSEHPVPWLLGLLATTAFLPFFALAANGPTLQRWIGGRDPYFLFAASNGGSLLGLFAYPLLIEPNLTLRDQGRAWAVAYGAAAVLVVACAFARPKAAPAEEPEAQGEPIDNRRRAKWLALAFVPSSLMLGVTTYATRDLTPFPLLWVLPLAIYLLTFVAAFAPNANTERLTRDSRIALPGIAIVLVYTLPIGSHPRAPDGVHPHRPARHRDRPRLPPRDRLPEATLAAPPPPPRRPRHRRAHVPRAARRRPPAGAAPHRVLRVGRARRRARRRLQRAAGAGGLPGARGVPAGHRRGVPAQAEAADNPSRAARVLLPRQAPHAGDGPRGAFPARHRRGDRARAVGRDAQQPQRRDRARVRPRAQPVEAADPAGPRAGRDHARRVDRRCGRARALAQLLRHLQGRAGGRAAPALRRHDRARPATRRQQGAARVLLARRPGRAGVRRAEAPLDRG